MSLGKVLGLFGLICVVSGVSRVEAGPASQGIHLVRLTVGSPAVDAQKKALDAALERFDAAVKQTGADDATKKDFDAADAASKNVSEVLAKGKSLAETDEGYRRYAGDAGAQFAIAKSRLRKNVKAFEVAVGLKALKESVAQLTTALEKAKADDASAADLEAVRGQVKALEATLEGAKKLEGKDKGYAAEATAARNSAKAALATAEARALQLQVAGHLATVQAAEADAKGRMDALSAEAKPAAFSEVEASVQRFKEAIDAGAELAKKDRAHAATLAKLSRQQPEMLASIKQRRLEGAEAAVKASLTALGEDAGAKDFDAVSAQIARLDELSKQDADFAKTHTGHRRFVAQVSARSAKYTASVQARRVALQVSGHKAKLEGAVAEVNAALEALEGEPAPAAFSAAEDKIKALETVLKVAEDIAKKDRTYAGQVAAQGRQVPGYRATVVRRRIEVLASGLDAQFSGLPEAPGLPELEPVEQVLSSVEAAAKEGAPLARSDRALAGALRAVQGNVRRRRSQLDQLKLDAEIRPHQAKLQAASDKLEAALQTLEGEPKPADFEAADKAKAEVEALVTSGAPLAKRSRTYAGVLATKQRSLPAQANKIATLRTQRAIAGHRAKVEAAKVKADESIEALTGKSEHELYVAAEEAVAALKKEVEAGQELGAADRGHRTFLAGLLAAHPDMRATIRQRRIETAEAGAKEKLDGLQGIATAAAFGQAEAALKRLETVTESNRSYAEGHKGYARFIAGVDARIKGYRKSIVDKRANSAVAAHAAKLEEAMAAAKAAMGALQDSPKASDFEAADKAVEAAEREVSAGEPVAKSSRAHAGLLAQSTKTLKGHRGTIARRRLEVEVAAQRAQVQAQAAEVQTRFEGLQESPAPSAFTQATEAVDALNKVVEASQPTAAKDRGFAGYVAEVKRDITSHRAFIAKRRVEVAQAAASASVEGLDDAAEAEAITEASTLVDGLQSALTEAQPHAKDRSLSQVVRASNRSLQGLRGRLGALSLEAEVRPHRNKLDAAEKAAADALEAIKEEPKPADFRAATDAVASLESTIEAGAPLGAKSKPYAQRLAALKRALPGQKKQIEARRTEVVIAAFKASVDEAEIAAESQIQAVEAEPTAASFKLFEEAAEAWQQTLQTGTKLAEKDRGMARYMAESNRKLAGMRARAEKRRAAQALEGVRARVDEAEAKARKSLQDLGDTASHEDYQAAETAIAALMTVLDEGDEQIATDRGLRARAAKLRNEKLAMRAMIRQRRIEVADKAAVATIEAIDDEPSASAFRDAERAVKQLETVTDSNASFGDKHSPFKRFVAQTRARVLAHRAAIDKKQGEATVNAHKVKVQAKAEALKARIEALDAEPGPAAFAAAELAVKGLDEEVRSGEPVEATSRTYKGYLNGQRKAVASAKRHIVQQRVALEVSGHRARVEEAASAVEASVSALDADAPAAAAFSSATESVDALAQAIEDGQATAAKDKGHAKYLAGIKRSLKGRRRTIASRRVAVASAAVEASMEALSGEPSEEDFVQAEASLTALETALGAANKKTKAHRATVSRRRLEVRVAPHRAKALAAEQAVQEKLQALAEQTDPAEFQAATAAVRALESTLEEGNALALESASYGKELSARKKKLPGYGRRIDARRSEVVLAAWTATVEEAKEGVEEKIAALDGEGATAGAFEAATEAANELEAVLGQSDKLASKSKAVAKQVAAHTRSLQGYRQKIARQRDLLRIEAHRARVMAAKQAADAALQSLDGDSKHEDYQAAEEAIFALKTELDAGDEFAASDTRYAKFLRGLHAQRPSMRGIVRQRRVEAAEAKAKALIEGLEGDVSESDYATAYQGVARLESVIQSNASFGKKDKQYARFSAAAMKRVPGHRAAIDMRRVNVVKGELDARMTALDEAPGGAAFSAAESALAKYSETVKARAQSGGGKAVKKLAAGIPALRTRITMRRIEVAEDAANAQVAAASEEPGDDVFTEAEKAVERYEGVLTDARRADKVGAKLQKRLKVGEKKATAMRRKIAAERVGVLVRPHRAKVQERLSAAAELVSGLSDESSAEDFEAAQSAVAELEVEVGRGDGLRKKSKAHGKFLNVANKKAVSLSRGLKRQRTGQKVAAHKAELQQAQEAAQSAVDALSEADRPDFDAADKAIEAFKEKVAEGADLALSNRAYKKVLKAARRRVPGWRAQVVGARVDLVQAGLQAQMEALSDSPSPQAFTQAHDAVAAVDRVLKDNKGAIKANKKLKKRAAKLRKSLPGKSVSIEVARVAAARNVAASLMAELGEDPSQDALDSAEEGLDNLDKVLKVSSANKARAKKKSLKKALKAAKKVAKRDRVRLAEAKAAGVLRPHRQALSEATQRAATVMGDLGKRPDEDQVADADAAVKALVEAVKNGSPHAKKSRAFGKSLAKARKVGRGYVKKLNRLRVREKVEAHREKVLTAKSELDERIAGLDDKAEHQDYQDAMLGVSAFGKLVDEGQPLADRDKKYRKFLSKMQKRRTAYPSKIRQRRVGAAVEAAQALAGSLASTPDDEDVAAAREAISRARTVLESNSKSGGSKKFKAFIASQRRLLWRFEADVATAVARGALAALQDGASASDFEKAEEAVRTQAEMVTIGKKVAKRDKRLKKVLGKLKKQTARNRGAIQTQRLTAAVAVAQESVDALAEDTASAAVYDAERAVEALDDRIKATKKPSKRSKSLKKVRRSALRKSKAFKKAIKRARRGTPAKVKKKSKKRRRRGRRRRRRAS